MEATSVPNKLGVAGVLLLGSIALPNLNFILAFSGSITGTLISVVMPILFYHQAYKDKKWIKRIANVVLVIGCLTGVLAFHDSML